MFEFIALFLESLVYRCSFCKRVSNQRSAQKRWIQYRTDGSIYRELPACNSCLAAIRDGVSPVELLKDKKPKKSKTK